MKIGKVFTIDSQKNKLGELSVGVGIDIFKNFSRENRKKSIYTSIPTGFCWEYHTAKGDLHEVEIFEDNKNIFAYPSPNMDLMIVLFDYNSNHYPHPNNLVVFEPNGKVKHIVSVPKLLSEEAKRNADNPFGERKEGVFYKIGWIEEKDLIMYVNIDFGCEMTEVREFDPYNGVIGKIIRVSGRY